MNHIIDYYNRRKKRLARRGIRFDWERPSEDYDWITINGVHTPIDDGGNIAGGAGGKFKGNKYTGAKMQRSKKRQAKVSGGSASFKLDRNKIKSKKLLKDVDNYAKEHDGQLPDKDTMADITGLHYAAAKMKLRKIQDDFKKKYGFHKTNLAESAGSFERRIEDAKKNRDTFEKTDPEWERWNERIEQAQLHLQEYYNDPEYEAHKKDYDRLKKAVEAADSARQDAKAFLVNKGRKFKTAEDAANWLEVSGWISDSSYNTQYPTQYGRLPSVSIDSMSPKFAGGICEAIGQFQNKFSKLSNVLTAVSLIDMWPGEMGGYDPETSRMEFASSYYSLNDMHRGEDSYNENVRKGHFPKGTTTYSVPFHEMTHAVEDKINDYDRNNEGKLGGRKVSDIVLERVSKRLNLMPAETKAKVSRYAMREYPTRPEYANVEFLAEAISEAYTSESPREVARLAAEEFEKIYHEIFD